MRARRRAAALLLVVASGLPMVVTRASAASPTSSPTTSPAPTTSQQSPAVTTVAGPGYCSTVAHRDAMSASVRALAVDARGDVFFDTGPPAAGPIAHVATDGGVSLLSTGVPSGRPSPAPGAAPSLVPTPGRLAPDGSGGVVVAAGARVIDVAATNSLTTIAGDPESIGDSDGSGSAGDGGPAATARFAWAASVASDEAGNLFVADVSGARHTVIRFINRSARSVTFFSGTPDAVVVGPGGIATIVGVAADAPAGEPGVAPAAARSAHLPGAPASMAVAGDRLYLAIPAPDARFGRVLAVDLGSTPAGAQGITVGPGQIAAVAGAGSSTTQALAFPLSSITGLAASDDGRLFLAEPAHHRILVADSAGGLTVFAGHAGGRQSDAGFDGDGQPAAGTRLNQPFDVKLGQGRVYIADQANDEIRAVDTDGVMRAVGGAGVATRWACSGGPGDERFGSAGAPTDVAVARSRVVYLALPALNRVQRIDLAGVVTTVAGGAAHDSDCRGTSCAGFSGDGGQAPDARLRRPTAVALGAAGELYILDAGNARVRVVNLGDESIQAHGVTVGPGDIATIAGNGTPGFSGDGGSALHARIVGAPFYAGSADSIASQIIDPRTYTLGSLAAGPHDELFIAGGPGAHVRRVDGRGVITSVSAAVDASSHGCCADPIAVADDARGNLYIADRGTDDAGTLHPHIWVMNRTGQAETVLGTRVARGATVAVVGDGMFGSDGDGGPATAASLEVPIAVATTSRGALFIAEAGVSKGGGVRLSDVREVDASGTITTAVGGGAVDFNGDDLPPVLTDLDLPSGVSADRCGNLFIADTGNDRVRVARLAGACQPIGDVASTSPGVPAALLPAVIGVAALSAIATLIMLRMRSRNPRGRTKRVSEPAQPEINEQAGR
jgi:hypothetical protein